LIPASFGMVFAGCTSDRPSTQTDSTPQSPTRISSPSPTPTPEPSPSPTASPTSEPVGTGGNPADLVVLNQTETAQSVMITVEDNEGSSIYANKIELDAGTRKRLDFISQNSSGTILITARLSSGAETTYKWDLNEEPADGWVSLYIESNDTLRMTYAIA